MLAALVRKEFLILFRDWHGLLLLFVMPLIFIVIMSLALKDVFSRHTGLALEVYYRDAAQSQESSELIAELKKGSTFRLLEYPVDQANDAKGKASSLMLLLEDVPLLLRQGRSANDLKLVIEAEPDTEAYVITLFQSLLREAQAKVYLRNVQERLRQSGSDIESSLLLEGLGSLPAAEVIYRHQDNQKTIPNSVQQNVPAWLVFAMFFVVVPLSNSLLMEQKSGTLRRLKTYNLSSFSLLLGKFIPYFFINQLQVVLMFCVGIWLLPHLGVDRLELGNSMPALMLLSVCISVMALGYGLCVASLAGTTEQATTIGGVGNILLAALGGVMVPVFVMPDVMQNIASFSPMYWAVQGFLDVMLRGGNLDNVLFEASLLFGLGLLLLLSSAVFLNRKNL